jgi:heme/copper-type cytochrome/quinol oxidase subunit 2
MRLLLGDAIFWIAAACCLVAQVAIVRSTLIPHVPGPGSERVPRPRTIVEAVWVLLPALALIGVFALTWRAIHEQPAVLEMRVAQPVPIVPAPGAAAPGDAAR